MTTGTINQTSFLTWNNCQTIIEPQKIVVAKSIMKPGIKVALENMILTSNKTKDREKAMEILASIEDYNKRFGYNNDRIREYKLKASLKRPKTSCSKVKGGPTFSQFTTAYCEDFPKKNIEETTATRPTSTENIIARPNKSSDEESAIKDNGFYQISPEKPFKSLSIYDKHSIYTNDYCTSDKSNNSDFKISPPDRAATASGERCHNPHPNKEFLVWRFPRESVNKEKRIPGETIMKSYIDNNFAQITDDQFNRAVRGNCRSTYQSDFLGGAVPFDQITPFYLQPEIKTGQKIKISTQQVDFARPTSLPVELRVPTNRYSSNKVRIEPAKGIIPQVTNKTYMNIFARTTYDEDINDRAHIIHDEIINNVQQKVDLSRLHNMRDLERAMAKNKNISDKESLDRIVEKLNEPEDFKRKTFCRKPFDRSGKLSWISNYPGLL